MGKSIRQCRRVYQECRCGSEVVHENAELGQKMNQKHVVGNVEIRYCYWKEKKM